MPPSQSQPLDVHLLWREVFDYSRKVFEEIPGYDKRDSELTAHAAVAGWFTPAGRRRTPSRPIRMPKLGPLARIGELRALWAVARDGVITRHVMSGVDLLWSPRLKACAAFPGGFSKVDSCRAPRVLDRVLKTWARGRGVRWANCVDVQLPMLGAGVPLLAIEYSSDKFSHGRQQRYVHHCEAGVMLRVSTKKTTQGAPSALLVRGGRLRLTKSGLEG